MHIIAEGKIFPKLRDVLQVGLTFMLTAFAWIFFRAESVADAAGYLARLFRFDFAGDAQYLQIDRYVPELLILIAAFVVIEWLSRSHEHPVQGRFKSLKAMLIIAGILTQGAFSNVGDFIYFQF